MHKWQNKGRHEYEARHAGTRGHDVIAGHDLAPPRHPLNTWTCFTFLGVTDRDLKDDDNLKCYSAFLRFK